MIPMLLGGNEPVLKQEVGPARILADLFGNRPDAAQQVGGNGIGGLGLPR